MSARNFGAVLALVSVFLASSATTELADQECSVDQKDTIPVENILSEGQNLYGESGNPPGFPCWFDVELARAGQKFAVKNYAQVGLGHTLSLILMLANTQSRRVLYVTNRSNTPETAFKRYTVTALHITVWYKTDVLSPEWMKSLTTIRRIHDGVGKYFNDLQATNQTDFYKPLVTKESGKEQEFKPNKKVWDAFNADLAESKYADTMKTGTMKYPLTTEPEEFYNQFILSITQWAFTALQILFPKETMIPNWTEMELKGFAHLWAVMCYVLGMDERFIICRDPNDFEGCKKYLQDMYHTYIIPSLFEMDYEGQVMVEAILRASEQFVGRAATNFALIVLLEDIIGVTANHLTRISSIQTRADRWIMKRYGKGVLRWPAVQRFLNLVTAGELQLASLKAIQDPGTNLTAVAEGLYYLD